MTPIPTLHTPRLTLRGWREADLEPFAAMYADELTARFIGGVQERHGAWRNMAARAGHWQLYGFGMFAVEETATGDFIGFGGPWRPDSWPDRELGYAIVRGHWGKGYATELVARARQFAYEDLGWTTAISLIVDDNIASQRVAAKLGAVKERDTEVLGIACGLYRYPGPDTVSGQSPSTLTTAST